MKFLKKWYTYQKERFPIVIYGTYMLVVVFASFCVANFSKLNGNIILNELEWIKILPMFLGAFLQFFMIRIVDEFKDYKEDCKYRPYRPVPRGLVSLKELGVIFVICAVIQLIISIIFNNLVPLLVVWLFFLIMSKGYFIKKFIDKHLLIEVTLDEILMPLLVIYLFGFIDINVINSSMIVYLFLIATYIIAWIVEIARKIRCKEDEEKGVRTYTALLGIKKAVVLLWGLETILFIIQLIILGQEYLYIAILLFIFVSIINYLFIKKQNKKIAKYTELTANMYIMIVYLSIGLLLV